jgi:hypothetical protein
MLRIGLEGPVVETASCPQAHGLMRARKPGHCDRKHPDKRVEGWPSPNSASPRLDASTVAFPTSKSSSAKSALGKDTANLHHTRARWPFTMEDACVKLAQLHPSS